MNTKYLLNKNATTKKYDVVQATEYLQQYGIAHNEKKTRDLIAKGKLAGKKPAGSNPLDRRIGYEITEKALYDLVVSEIPIMKAIFEELNGQAKENGKTTAKRVKKEVAANENQ